MASKYHGGMISTNIADFQSGSDQERRTAFRSYLYRCIGYLESMLDDDEKQWVPEYSEEDRMSDIAVRNGLIELVRKYNITSDEGTIPNSFEIFYTFAKAVEPDKKNPTIH